MAEPKSDLESMGYQQELLRDMGAFQNFALSFSVISILTGAVTLYAHGLDWGGPLVMTVGWPLVSFFTLFVAMSLAEWGRPGLHIWRELNEELPKLVDREVTRAMKGYDWSGSFKK